MHNYKQLKIWQRSFALSCEIMTVSSHFPKENRFDLTSQMIRSAISVPSNISEGTSRNTTAAFSQFLDYAIGSLFELETQLMIACECGFLEDSKLDYFIEETQRIQKMLYRFKQSLNS